MCSDGLSDWVWDGGLAVVIWTLGLVGCGWWVNSVVGKGGRVLNWYWKCWVKAKLMSWGSALAYSSALHCSQCGGLVVVGLHPYFSHSGFVVLDFHTELTAPLGLVFVLSHLRELYVWLVSVCWWRLCIQAWMIFAWCSLAVESTSCSKFFWAVVISFR